MTTPDVLDHLPPDRPSVQLNWKCPVCKGESFELFIKNACNAQVFPWPEVKVIHVGGWRLWRTDPEIKIALSALIQEAKASRRAPKADPAWLWCNECRECRTIPKKLLAQFLRPVFPELQGAKRKKILKAMRRYMTNKPKITGWAILHRWAQDNGLYREHHGTKKELYANLPAPLGFIQTLSSAVDVWKVKQPEMLDRIGKAQMLAFLREAGVVRGSLVVRSVTGAALWEEETSH